MIQQDESKRSFMGWLQESVTVKLVVIGVLILVLLIPSSMIEGLIRERSERQDEVVRNIAEQWAGNQLVKGPVLIIPYKKSIRYTDTARREQTREIIENLYILPEALRIKANVKSEVLHRGIFDAVVYKSSINISGNFASPDLIPVSQTADQMMLDKAKIIFSISDLKGLTNNPVVNADGQLLPAEPAYNNKMQIANGLQAAVNLTSFKSNAFKFSYTLELKGSDELFFTHLGKTTEVEATGDWQSPSFAGGYLPDTRQIDKNGFVGKWKMVHYNRPFPQQWVGADTLLNDAKKEADASFGVALRLPVDQYQKTIRTSKYAILIILLTFVSLFLTEVIRKQKIHVFNYFLIGSAMIIYYTLLLSFSEQVGYNLAYLIASVSTVTLISVFISSLLKNKKAAPLFAFILTVFYAFIFVIIQLEDLALMIGSIALFIIIAILMYFSRKINWDTH
jgi:inner membrane protein